MLEREDDYIYCEYIEVFDTKTGRTINESDNFPEVVKEVKVYLEQNK